jgi:hypothetical protein
VGESVVGVGESVGDAEGDELGAFVGESVGDIVGDDDDALGLSVGLSVEDAGGDALGEAVADDKAMVADDSVTLGATLLMPYMKVPSETASERLKLTPADISTSVTLVAVSASYAALERPASNVTTATSVRRRRWVVGQETAMLVMSPATQPGIAAARAAFMASSTVEFAARSVVNPPNVSVPVNSIAALGLSVGT